MTKDEFINNIIITKMRSKAGPWYKLSIKIANGPTIYGTVTHVDESNITQHLDDAKERMFKCWTASRRGVTDA